MIDSGSELLVEAVVAGNKDSEIGTGHTTLTK